MVLVSTRPDVLRHCLQRFSSCFRCEGCKIHPFNFTILHNGSVVTHFRRVRKWVLESFTPHFLPSFRHINGIDGIFTVPSVDASARHSHVCFYVMSGSVET